MRGFPEQLHDTTQKLTAFDQDTVIPAGINFPREKWFSIKAGNWNDPGTWGTIGERRSDYPTTITDDVYIRHSVMVNNGLSNVPIYNLYISSIGRLYWDTLGQGKIISVNGNINCQGTLDMSQWNTSDAIKLFGANNFIKPTNFSMSVNSGTGGFYYSGDRDQMILPLSYGNLYIEGSATASNLTAPVKYLVADTVLAGSLNISTGSGGTGGFDTSYYNLTVTTTTTMNNGFFRTSYSTTLLFIGALLVQNAAIFNLVGNPSIENRGGITFFGSSASLMVSGTGAWNFTTNSQNTSFAGLAQFNGPVSVVGAITVTNVFNSSSGIMQINNSLDNTSASGSFINKGLLYWNNASFYNFTMGSFDKDNFNTNIVGYIFNGSITLPYSTFQGLFVAGTGTKTLLADTTLGTSLKCGETNLFVTTLECSTYALTIGTTTALNGILSKTSSTGTVIFGGLITYGNSVGRISFTGNPNVEMRGGIATVNTIDTMPSGIGVTGYVPSDSHFITGTGTWTFNTNSQSISWNGGRLVWNCPVIISGAIVVTITNFVYQIQGTSNNENGGAGFIFNNTVNGTVAGSTLRAAGFVGFNNATLPMSTGLLDTTTSANTIGWLYSGTYSVPVYTYSSLYIAGAGTKTLTANTSISGNLTVGGINFGTGSDAILECSTFDLSVTGITLIAGVNGGAYRLSKNGAGTLTFIGLFQVGNNVGTSAGGVPAVNFTGNPNVEFRGGITHSNGASTQFVSGSGTYTFSTNSQTWSGTTAGGSCTWQWDCNVVISGTITLTLSGSTTTLILIGTINGTVSGSTLDNRFGGITTTAGMQYQNATRPMVTGVLQCNGAANTWDYNKSGNQDITGGTYRILTLAGTGTKTLQGNVVVATTYTLTAPATLALNGFTRT